MHDFYYTKIFISKAFEVYKLTIFCCNFNNFVLYNKNLKIKSEMYRGRKGQVKVFGNK